MNQAVLVGCILVFAIAALYLLFLSFFIQSIVVGSQISTHWNFGFEQNGQIIYSNRRILQVNNESDDSTCRRLNLSWKSLELAKESRMPPMLLSYPGSGNSWMRVVLEQATGFFSGSMEINDKEYQGHFPGERFCGIRHSVIKAHPQDFLPYLKDKPIQFKHKMQENKCKRGMITNFTYIIFVIRNPADAIWSQYQLLTNHSHVGRIHKSQFNESSWNAFVAKTALDWSMQWTNFVYPLITNTPAENIHILKYEEIVKVEKGISEIRSILKNLMNMSVSSKRVECSLLLSHSRTTTRPDSIDEGYVTAGFAFYQALKPKTACFARKALSSYIKFGNYSLELWPSVKINEDYRFTVSSLNVSCGGI